MNAPSARAAVSALHSVEFGVRDLDASVRFFEDVWGLMPVARDGTSAYLRAHGADHHAVVVHEYDENALVGATFVAPDRAAVDTLHERVDRNGGRTNGAPHPLDRPGGGYGFSFTDPERRALRVATGIATHADARKTPDRPYKLSHLALNASDADRSKAFFRDALGFRLRDETNRICFLGCNADHHSVGITRVGNTSIHHIAFEVPDLDSLMRGAARVRRAGHTLEWGPVKHGPGSNISTYFIDPDDHIIEYAAQMDQVDDATYVPGSPANWKPPIADNSDYWGFAAAPTERYHQLEVGAIPGAVAG